MPPALEVQSLTTGLPGNSQNYASKFPFGLKYKVSLSLSLVYKFITRISALKCAGPRRTSQGPQALGADISLSLQGDTFPPSSAFSPVALCCRMREQPEKLRKDSPRGFLGGKDLY